MVHDELGDDAPKFTWNSQEWEILPGGAKFGRKNDFGGFALSCDLVLTCLTAQFGDDLPQAAESVTYRDLDYTIATVSTAPGGYQLRIELVLNAVEK